MLGTGDTAVKKKLGENVRQREEKNLMTVLHDHFFKCQGGSMEVHRIPPWD